VRLHHPATDRHQTFSVDTPGRVVYRYKQPLRDGPTDVLLAIFLFRSWPEAVITESTLLR